MDPDLHEIYAKETAAHLATIHEFVASCALIAAPFPVTEDLHRACHTLSGTAKTAGARQGIKVAEPLNRYVRKLYDNSVGMPVAGLDALKDSATAIQQVVDNINEDTGFFLMGHERVINRLMDLEHAVDQEISRLAQTLDITTQGPALDEPVGLLAGSSPEDVQGATDVFTADDFALSTAKNGDTSDIIEIEPTDAKALEMLDWSFQNFPKEPAAAPPAARAAAPVLEMPLLDDPLADAETTRAAALEASMADDDNMLAEPLFTEDDDGPTRTMRQLEALPEGDDSIVVEATSEEEVIELAGDADIVIEDEEWGDVDLTPLLEEAAPAAGEPVAVAEEAIEIESVELQSGEIEPVEEEAIDIDVPLELDAELEPQSLPEPALPPVAVAQPAPSAPPAPIEADDAP